MTFQGKIADKDSIFGDTRHFSDRPRRVLKVIKIVKYAKTKTNVKAVGWKR